MSINNGGPAFPFTVEEHIPPNNICIGMTLRDWFAGMALQGLLQDTNYESDIRALTAAESYAIADAMLKEREK